MKYTFHEKLTTPRFQRGRPNLSRHAFSVAGQTCHAKGVRRAAWFAAAVLGAIMIALPGVIFAADDGLGTNVVRNIRIQTTGVIDLSGIAITNWSQVGSTADVASLQGATNVLNTRVNVDFAAATNNLYTATNALNTRVNVDLAAATNNLYNATNVLNTRVNVDLAGATNKLYNATNALNTSVSALYVRTTNWDNAVLMKEGAVGDTIAYSNLYYYSEDGNWYKANATNSTTAKGLLGLAIGGSLPNGLLMNGQCTNMWGFAAGKIIYMDTNAGALATSPPTGTNNIVRIVGYAISTTNIYFNPDRTYIQILGGP